MWSLITWAMSPTVYAGFSRSRQRWSLGWRWFLGINPYQRTEKIHSELQCRFRKALANLSGVNEALGVLHGPKWLASFNQSPDTCYHQKVWPQMSWLCADETQTPGGCWLTAFLQLVAGPVWKGDLAGVSSYVPNPPCGEILPAIGENKASILTKPELRDGKRNLKIGLSP